MLYLLGCGYGNVAYFRFWAVESENEVKSEIMRLLEVTLLSCTKQM